MHHLLQFSETFGTDGGLVVNEFVDHRGLVVNEFVDDRAGLEEIADNLWCGEVVVHGVVAFLAQTLHHLFRFSVTLWGNCNAL